MPDSTTRETVEGSLRKCVSSKTIRNKFGNSDGPRLKVGLPRVPVSRNTGGSTDGTSSYRIWI